MKYRIVILPAAMRLLAGMEDRRIQEKIRERIEALKDNPEQQGKPLLGELGGYRSLRAVGQRYQIIYRVEGERVTVLIVAIGIRKEGDRKDIYKLAKKLVRLQLLS